MDDGQSIVTSDAERMIVSNNQDAIPVRDRRHGKWVWLLICVPFIIAVSISVAYIFVEKDADRTTLLNSIGELSSYIENRPEGYESYWGDEEFASENDYIYAVEILQSSNYAIREYYNGLDKKLAEFIDLANGSISSDSLNNYYTVIRILKNAIDYDEIGDGLIAAYLDGKAEQAKKYYEENISCLPIQGSIETICKMEERYYGEILKEQLYDNKEEASVKECLSKLLSDASKTLLSTEIRKLHAAVREEIKNA